MVKAIIVSLLALFALVPGGDPPEQENRPNGGTLWDEAITAKGGRERLQSIHTFAIHETTVHDTPSSPQMSAGKVSQIVCRLPDGWWEFLDYRPGKMGYSIRVVNAATGGHSPEGRCGRAPR
jgi:hypothetical protein